MSIPVPGSVLVPGSAALVFLLVVSYLYRQAREMQFRLWQFAWGAYFGYFLFISIDNISPWWVWPAVGRILIVVMATLLLMSSRVQQGAIRIAPRMMELGLTLAGSLWAVAGAAPWTARAMDGLVIVPEIAFAALLLFVAWRFYRLGRVRDSVGFRLFSFSLCAWAALLSTRQIHGMESSLVELAGVFSVIPEILLGLSMVMAIVEYERGMIQENALALSTLDADTTRALAAEEIAPAVGKLLERMMPAAKVQSALIWIDDPLRSILPAVYRGLSPYLSLHLQTPELGDAISKACYRRGGIATIRSVVGMDRLGRQQSEQGLEELKSALLREDVRAFTAISLEGRQRQIGFILLPHPQSRTFGAGELRVLLGQAKQISATLDNYVLMHETQRRTREHEMLTQIGQVVSSRLDPDEVLKAIHKELARLFDTSSFYVAFADGNDIRYEFETVDGVVQPKRMRPSASGLAEYILRTGDPILLRSEIQQVKKDLGVSDEDNRVKSFVGVPVKMGDRTAGVICAQNFGREFVYEQRDLVMLQTAAGQLAVALENALLYSEASRRAQYLTFLNNIASIAISSQGSDEMLEQIVREIQRNFEFDHIGIGVIDYTAKDVEIRAEAGTTAQLLGKRIPLGVGIMGRAARTEDTVLVQNTSDERLFGLLQDSRSVVCIPLKYGDTLLGLLNVESRKEGAFEPQDVLLLNTLADLLATALHNALVFQKMQQQSITDSLTGIKTRRFFLEALQSEWKRASRSGRPFSVVLLDLDKFKEVNDTLGHLEGDLVIARVGRLLEQKCRQSNVVARYGGDEFVVLMPETGVEQSLILSERLRVWIATDPMLSERHITGSFGVASFPLHGATVNDIIRVADAGMYVSKHAGGNRVSTAEAVSEDNMMVTHRQHMLAFIEGFLHRDNLNPESAGELVSTLQKFSTSLDESAARELLLEAVRSLNHSTELRDSRNGSHGEQVAVYAEIIGKKAGLSASDLEDLKHAARVHDVGKVLLPARVFNKSGMLSAEDFRLLSMHSMAGAAILEIVPGWEQVRDWVLHHHENFDGTGYPDKLSGSQIPLGARILTIADNYVKLTSDDSYSPAKSSMQALSEMENESGTQFDPALLAILVEHVRGASPARAASD